MCCKRFYCSYFAIIEMNFWLYAVKVKFEVIDWKVGDKHSAVKKTINERNWKFNGSDYLNIL